MNGHSTKGVEILPRTKQQFEDMRLRSIGLINEAALKLFTTKGYHATTINAIAKEAGVATGLMYNYFSSKEALLISMVEGHFQNMIDSISEEVGGNWEAMDIRVMVDTILNAVTKSDSSWKLMINILFQPDVDQTARERLIALAFHQEAFFKSHFIVMGVSRPEESAKALMILLHAIFIYYAYNQNTDELKLIRDTVIERVIKEGV